ncbi:MAG: hypothetical protein JWN62_3014 [Acidimicrobiales bacterium]|nr:hypothetical protein [Acidimicrobiales bacterium]
MRAFLQRCEVRLSTVHRVATALLSGAGILVLLPALQRDAIETVMRSFMTGTLTVPKALLAATVALSVGLSLTLVWLVVKQLTQFYFHANHISRKGEETFTPRFTLTGLRLPAGELSAASVIVASELRAEQRNLDLLVPANTRGRNRIDKQLDAYPALRHDQRTDGERVEALLELAASRTRSLLEEAVKVELGLVRHVLRLQVVVLRYVKALLVVVTTVLATYISSAATGAATESSIADQRWIAATYCMWAPMVILSATAPVRWIESLLRAEGATGSSVRNDPEFTRVENIASYVAIVAWALSAAASVALLFDGSTSPRAFSAGITTTACSAALLAVAIRVWRRSEPVVA